MLQFMSGLIGRELLARHCHQTVGFCTWFSSELALIVFCKMCSPYTIFSELIFELRTKKSTRADNQGPLYHNTAIPTNYYLGFLNPNSSTVTVTMQVVCFS